MYHFFFPRLSYLIHHLVIFPFFFSNFKLQYVGHRLFTVSHHPTCNWHDLDLTKTSSTFPKAPRTAALTRAEARSNESGWNVVMPLFLFAIHNILQFRLQCGFLGLICTFLCSVCFVRTVTCFVIKEGKKDFF